MIVPLAMIGARVAPMLAGGLGQLGNLAQAFLRLALPTPSRRCGNAGGETVGAVAAQVAPLNVPAPVPVQAPAQTIAPVVTLGAA